MTITMRVVPVVDPFVTLESGPRWGLQNQDGQLVAVSLVTGAAGHALMDKLAALVAFASA